MAQGLDKETLALLIRTAVFWREANRGESSFSVERPRGGDDEVYALLRRALVQLGYRPRHGSETLMNSLEYWGTQAGWGRDWISAYDIFRSCELVIEWHFEQVEADDGNL